MPCVGATTKATVTTKITTGELSGLKGLDTGTLASDRGTTSPEFLTEQSRSTHSRSLCAFFNAMPRLFWALDNASRS